MGEQNSQGLSGLVVFAGTCLVLPDEAAVRDAAAVRAWCARAAAVGCVAALARPPEGAVPGGIGLDFLPLGGGPPDAGGEPSGDSAEEHPEDAAAGGGGGHRPGQGIESRSVQAAPIFDATFAARGPGGALATRRGAGGPTVRFGGEDDIRRAA